MTALYDVVTEVYDCLENKEKINLILYDFSNAFLAALYPNYC